MVKSVGSYALLLVLVLAAVTCSRSKPASKTPSAASLGQSPAAFAGRLGDAVLGQSPFIYEGPCVDGQHNVDHCGDCQYVKVELDPSNGHVRHRCTQCKAGNNGYITWTAAGHKVHDLGSHTCHQLARWDDYDCRDGQRGIDSCGLCSYVDEVVNYDNTRSVRCINCDTGANNWRWLTLAAGESVANLGDFGCSPVRPFGSECVDGQRGVNKCGSCSLMTWITNFDNSKDITCVQCSSGSLKMEAIKVGEGELLDDLGVLACGEPQPPHDYEGPCRDSKNNIEECGSCRAIKTKLREDGETRIECTECSAGLMKTDIAIHVKEGATVANMGIHGCEPAGDYSGECQDGQHHVNSCGSCQAISVVTNLDHSVHVQCTQCRPNGKKDHIKKGENSKVPDMGEFGCSL